MDKNFNLLAGPKNNKADFMKQLVKEKAQMSENRNKAKFSVPLQKILRSHLVRIRLR